MKTLVIIGAARESGYTRQTVDLSLEHLDSEGEIIDAYCTEVKPCVDCRFCWKKRECAIEDGMQEIYQKLEEADSIILVSPMYFHSITGRVKSLIDRFQVYWAGYMRNDTPETSLRKGATLMMGSAPSLENQLLGEEIVPKNLLNNLGIKCLGQVCLLNSDRDSPETRLDIVVQIVVLAEKTDRVVK